MSIDTIIDSNQNMVIHIVTGPLMLNEIKQATVQLYSDPHFRPSMNILVDLRNGTVRNLSQQDIEDFVAMNVQMGQQRGAGYSAIVTARDIDFGIARQIQSMLDSTSRRLGVFRDYQAGVDWLYQQTMP
ncbi:MAG: hypothetical protein OEX03_00670 [Gammaproteobacteria bacterium]|nr:hypothetical protein [Gammaproteobacteria bacterium]